VKQYQEHRGQIAAVITDSMMPGLDGPVLIRSLRGLNPEVNIICVSGLAPGHALAEIERSDPSAFLRKPFTSTTLLTTLRQVLDLSNAQPQDQ
jgi:CheY-like chemotaxis protein